MKQYEGKNLTDVLAACAREKGVAVEELTYQVIEEKKGLLGIGNKVIIEAYCDNDIAAFLYDYLDTFFQDLGIEVAIEVEKKDDMFVAELNAENNAVIIGRAGQTLQALNLVCRSALSSTFKRRVKVLVDINNYKEERYEKVRSMARRIAKTVQRTKVSALLDPMPNDERKAVHQYLSGMKHIRTESEGEGRGRRLRIIYTEEE